MLQLSPVKLEQVIKAKRMHDRPKKTVSDLDTPGLD
jgi:hypothetical protein